MPKRNPRWLRVPGFRPGTLFATWKLRSNPDYIVKHCGHPTAIWPYFGLTRA